MVQGGKIVSIGKKIDVPLLARKLSGRGKWVTPGLIDVWSRLGARLEDGAGDVLADAADVFDPYARWEIEAALAQGVTAVYLPASARDGVGGVGAVVRLSPDPSSDRVVTSRAALHIALGNDPTQRPLQRVRSAMQIRKAFQDAQDYRTAREDYAADLEDYEKKLKERAGAKTDGEERPTGGAGHPGRAADVAGALDDGALTADGATAVAADEPAADNPTDPTQPRPRGRRRTPPSPEELRRLEQLRGDGGGGKPEATDDLKKPEEPPRDRRKELLVKALDGDLPVRVEAHRPEDILNALDIAAAFNLRLIVEGATGAHLVAAKLAQREVSVVLGAPATSMLFQGGPRRFEVPDDARRLSDAGVAVFLGSGDGGETPCLALHAALRVARGAEADACLRAITADAATLLGVESRIGRLEAGMSADFVVWSDHPFSPGARVERVFIEGVEVYTAPAPGGEENK